MTREIKFRAWDKKEKKMLQVTELGFDYNEERFLKTGYAWLDGKWGVRNADDYMGRPQVKSWLGEKRDAEVIELMQFTGLKDKNGKEIYEGDIVKCEELICEVKYITEPGYVGFAFDNGRVIDFAIENNKVRDFEVIGNIYENKDLIK